jgi:tripartite-type tricarboxylate transporter receptor subunit TctC
MKTIHLLKTLQQRFSAASVAASVACLAAASFISPLAAAADYPTKPVRIVIGFSAGGGADLNLRLIAGHLSTDLGQQVLVDNRPGASGVIAAQYVLTQPEDGYTLLYASTALVIHSAKDKPTINLKTQFTPLSIFGRVNYVMFVPAASPPKTLAELIAWAKANPGKLNYSSVGIGSTGHLGFEVFKRVAGIGGTHIPFKSTAATTAAVAAGDIQVGLEPMSAVRPLMDAGKLRVLALASPKRSSHFPDIPALEEQGIQGVDVVSWVGLMAKKGVSEAVIDRLSKGLSVAMAKPEVRTVLERAGYNIGTGTPDEQARQIDREIPQFARVIREEKIDFE